MLTVTESRCELVRNATAEARFFERCWDEAVELGDGRAVAGITALALAWASVTCLAQLHQIAEQG
jgi:hypothetical protein